MRRLGGSFSQYYLVVVSRHDAGLMRSTVWRTTAAQCLRSHVLFQQGHAMPLFILPWRSREVPRKSKFHLASCASPLCTRISPTVLLPHDSRKGPSKAPSPSHAPWLQGEINVCLGRPSLLLRGCAGAIVPTPAFWRHARPWTTAIVSLLG